MCQPRFDTIRFTRYVSYRSVNNIETVQRRLVEEKVLSLIKFYVCFSVPPKHQVDCCRGWPNWNLHHITISNSKQVRESDPFRSRQDIWRRTWPFHAPAFQSMGITYSFCVQHNAAVLGAVCSGGKNSASGVTTTPLLSHAPGLVKMSLLDYTVSCSIEAQGTTHA